jgi:EAL and modified HD-GYP domain-containing signal transduction protein
VGFELFAGPFYASRHKAAVRKVPVGEMGTLVSLAAMQSGSATIEELEQVIDRDVGLSVKLLRYINSAHVGMRGSITSIRQAVMMLGSRGVSRWALLVALTGGPSTPRELSVVGLTRARMCELLGSGSADIAGDELFTVGLLSVADALLEVPLETIVEELPLAEDVAGALLRRDGPAGAILNAVVSYEQGEFDASSLQSHGRGIASSYRDALGWAVQTVSSLG